MKNINLFYQCHVAGQDSAIWQLKCHLRIIYQQFGQQIVIVSPQNCEIGWFIPSQIEKLATQIIQDSFCFGSVDIPCLSPCLCLFILLLTS